MPTVWFIRHGESVSNADLRTTHPADSDLTERGAAEAQAIVHSFREKPSLIVVSPYLRARKTAEPTIAHFQPVHHEEWPVYEFTFLDPAKYLGTTGSERWPYVVEYWQRNDPHYKDGGIGESFAEFMGRLQATLTRLRNHPADFIAIFGHGLFFRGIAWATLSGVNEATAQSMTEYSHFVRSVSMPNGGIMKSYFAPDGRIYISGFDATHLSLCIDELSGSVKTD